MAQPLFNEHPLQDYLRQSGDIFEPIPGAMSDLPDPFSEECAYTDTDADLRLWSWLTTPALHLVQLLNVIVTSAQNHHSTLEEFSEKFQYDVISSSLLSSSITAPSSTRRRSSSSTGDAPPDDLDLKFRTKPSPPIPSHPAEPRSRAWSLTLFCLCCISLFFDSFILCVLMGTALYYLESYTVQPGNLPDFIAPTLGSLNDLIAVANLWDSAVHEAINLLELEESMSSSLSPSSPLRVALHSSLQSTQVQSDNVRHVLVGLTAPSALAQLSEMYAPPSPMKPLATLHSRSGSATAGSHMRTTSSDKRATWNGSVSYNYAALANAGSPSRRSLMRWEKRRSDLSALLLRPNGATMSAPTTPKPGKSLDGVEERGNNSAAASLSEQEGDTDAVVPLNERGQFASAALEFQRQRRSRGVETLFLSTRSPPPKYTAISPQPPTSTHITRLGNRSPTSQSPPPSSYSASRFTAMQMPRHPLSLYSLTLTLNGALAARRYAASHLLALRFGSGDGLEDSGRGDDSYWEDVRAVMALLTSTLANATAPLVEALEAAEHERLLTENPTPTTAHSRASSESHTRPSSFHQHQHQQKLARRTSHVTSFAPLPSHLTRFAAHVDALTNALHDAREHLESCVASLRDGTATSTASGSPQDAPALRAYERLRRELGLALRECERGREPLLELLLPPRAPSPDDEDEDDEEVPALGPDAESSDSEKDASSRAGISPQSSLPSSPTHAVLVESRPPGNEDEEEDAAAAAHDRKRGVLVVGLERLPVPGIEQVFEADPGADAGPDADGDVDADGPRPLARPRSKLSREERIAAAKARRATGGLGLSVGDQGDQDSTGGVQWAPVGDVVQELKDVIWKVGEQRRMRERRQREEGEEPDRAPITDDVFTCPT